MPSTSPHTARPDITLCLTIGKRPRELQRTLESLFRHVQFEQVIAINDFGDADTNAVFRQQCPHGKLISLGYNQGHHRAIDTMYREVSTPYVMHCEDDWAFDAAPDFDAIIAQLDSRPELAAVVLRKIGDFPLTDKDFNKIENIPPATSHQPPATSHSIGLISLNKLHDQWHGFTFNPHIAKIALWQSLAPFAAFKKERHISRHLRRNGKYVAYLREGICQHIGFESIANPPPATLLAKIRAKIFG